MRMNSGCVIRAEWKGRSTRRLRRSSMIPHHWPSGSPPYGSSRAGTVPCFPRPPPGWPPFHPERSRVTHGQVVDFPVRGLDVGTDGLPAGDPHQHRVLGIAQVEFQSPAVRAGLPWGPRSKASDRVPPQVVSQDGAQKPMGQFEPPAVPCEPESFSAVALVGVQVFHPGTSERVQPIERSIPGMHPSIAGGGQRKGIGRRKEDRSFTMEFQ